MKVPRAVKKTTYTYLITGPANPMASSPLFRRSANSSPGIVPHTINNPNLKSTLPKRLCFKVLIIDDPIIRVKPVPTVNKGGTPKTNSPPVIKKPPPTPKNPPKVPTTNPSRTNKKGLMIISALGKNKFTNHYYGNYDD